MAKTEQRKQLREKGVVYLVELGNIDGVDLAPYVGYWEAEVDGKLEIVENGAGWPTMDSALAWGAARSELILLAKADGHNILFDLHSD